MAEGRTIRIQLRQRQGVREGGGGNTGKLQHGGLGYHPVSLLFALFRECGLSGAFGSCGGKKPEGGGAPGGRGMDLLRDLARPLQRARSTVPTVAWSRDTTSTAARSPPPPPPCFGKGRDLSPCDPYPPPNPEPMPADPPPQGQLIGWGSRVCKKAAGCGIALIRL